MNGYTIAFFVLCLASIAAGAAVLQEEPALKPLHFKMEVVADELHTMTGCIEGSQKGSYTKAVLDLDGDGEPDKTVDLVEGRFGETEGRFGFSLDMELGGTNLNLELHGPTANPYVQPVYMNYTLTTESNHAFFINGTARFYATAEEAAEGKAIRIGPPFHFDVGSSARGDKALVNVGLKDANGCTLRIASGRGPDGSRSGTSNIQLTFLADGKEGASLEATYG